jgi:hypothetical protein
MLERVGARVVVALADVRQAIEVTRLAAGGRVLRSRQFVAQSDEIAETGEQRVEQRAFEMALVALMVIGELAVLLQEHAAGVRRDLAGEHP